MIDEIFNNVIDKYNESMDIKLTKDDNTIIISNYSKLDSLARIYFLSLLEDEIYNKLSLKLDLLCMAVENKWETIKEIKKGINDARD